MNTAALIVYIAGIVITYFCFIAFTKVTEENEGMYEPMAFFVSLVWPFLMACGIAYLPFYLIRKFGLKVRKFIHTKKYTPLNETYKSSDIY